MRRPNAPARPREIRAQVVELLDRNGFVDGARHLLEPDHVDHRRLLRLDPVGAHLAAGVVNPVGATRAEILDRHPKEPA